MKIFLLSLLFCVLTSCAPKTEVVSFLKENTSTPEINQNIVREETPEVDKKKEYVADNSNEQKAGSGKIVLKVDRQKRFPDLIREEGIPFDNIFPRKKDQIAIYKKEESYVFYFMKKGIIFSAIEYSLSAIEEMKRNNQFPEKVIEDLENV